MTFLVGDWKIILLDLCKLKQHFYLYFKLGKWLK